MPSLIARHQPEIGETFNVRTSLLSKVGSAFSLLFGGKRVGLARVVKDYSKDEKFHVEVHGHGLTNMANHIYKMRVENLYDQDSD